MVLCFFFFQPSALTKRKGQKWVYPPTFQTKGSAPRYRHRLSPVVIPNHSKLSTDAETKRPRPVQSMGVDFFCELSATSKCRTGPPERRAAHDIPFCPRTTWVYPPSATILSSPLFVHFFGLFRPLLSEVYPLLTTFRPSKVTLHVTTRQNIQDVHSPHHLFSRPAELCRKQSAHK